MQTFALELEQNVGSKLAEEVFFGGRLDELGQEICVKIGDDCKLLRDGMSQHK